MIEELVSFSDYNMSSTRHKFSLKNKILRVAWNITYIFLFRPFSLRVFKKWRVFLLRSFGGNVSYKAMVNSNVKIWAPWNLTIGDYSCLGPQVDCYNQGKITIGENVTISQKTYLCASSHDYTKASHDLLLKPISIEDRVWVAADAYIGPGVEIKEGSVIGARSVVTSNLPAWMVCVGFPCKPIKKREFTNA